jgi:hypothetical protein
MKSRASTPPPPPPPGFCFTIWFPQQRQREKTRDKTSCLKTQESRNRKKMILILISSNQDLSSLLSSVLLLLFSRLQQRSAPPPSHAPPMLGTRERSCPFHPCKGPESRPAFCGGLGPAPPTAGLIGGNPGVRECRAMPGRPSVTDLSSVTDRQEN